MTCSGNKYRQYYMRKNTKYTKSEMRLLAEILHYCVFDDDNVWPPEVIMQHSIYNGKYLVAILDIAVPELKIGYRVMGEVHGMPFAMKPRDELQLYHLKHIGWDIVDVWHSERPDLWK